MTMTPRSILAAGALAVALLAGVPSAFAEDVTYRNERFGTSATFPGEAFTEVQPAPTNGDGLAWKSPDGAELFVYARPNRGDETPRSVVAGRAADDEVTYRRSGESWAVVSGFRDGKIFYERYIFRGELIHSVAIRYPKGVRDRYDPLVGKISMSLKASGKS